jgi:hypothetical protein
MLTLLPSGRIRIVPVRVLPCQSTRRRHDQHGERLSRSGADCIVGLILTRAWPWCDVYTALCTRLRVARVCGTACCAGPLHRRSFVRADSVQRPHRRLQHGSQVESRCAATPGVCRHPTSRAQVEGGTEARRCGRPADDTEMRFGALISTSNELVSDVVTVETNHPLIWTTELRA